MSTEQVGTNVLN